MDRVLSWKDFGRGRAQQGLKPNIDWKGFIGPAKAVPLLQSRRFEARLISCPCYRAEDSRRGLGFVLEGSRLGRNIAGAKAQPILMMDLRPG